MKAEFITTRDGSSSLYLPERQEHYHSIHGALRESKHVYVQNGLCDQKRNNLNVLEFGFGTGLNVLTTLLHSISKSKKIYYRTIEKYPLPEQIWSQLNYCDLINEPDCARYFQKIHRAGWEKEIKLTPEFILRKTKISFEQFRSEPNKHHVIYYDAFAPDVQPELWTIERFTEVLKLLAPGGTLVTYSSKGAVRRTLKATGFEVEKIPGPPGKREMLRARKPKKQEE